MSVLIKHVINELFLKDIYNDIKELCICPEYISEDDYKQIIYKYIQESQHFQNLLKEIPNSGTWLMNEKKYISRKPYQNKKNKCMCRIWNNGYGGQCSNVSKKDNLCLRHFNMKQKQNILPFGLINEAKPLRNMKDNSILLWKT
jgi:hypothetical protein